MREEAVRTGHSALCPRRGVGGTNPRDVTAKRNPNEQEEVWGADGGEAS